MTTLTQVKDVPFTIRVTETNAFVREIPYRDQPKKPLRWPADFDGLANHALHNHYCISFLNCSFQLNFENLMAHFDWCCRYLYFNFEQSVLRLEIFTKLEQLQLSKNKLEYLQQTLATYPVAYHYNLNSADHRQKWALLKKSNFQKCADFRQIAETDKIQRTLLASHLQMMLENYAPVALDKPLPLISRSPKKENYPAPDQLVKLRERESSLYNFLKLNDNLSPKAQQNVIGFLYETLEPCFRQHYSREVFSGMFTKDNAPVLELVKKTTWDNQCLTILFRELKKARILEVPWSVIDKKIRVFKNGGSEFSSFSQVSNGKIDLNKRRKIAKLVESLLSMIKSELASNKKI